MKLNNNIKSKTMTTKLTKEELVNLDKLLAEGVWQMNAQKAFILTALRQKLFTIYQEIEKAEGPVKTTADAPIGTDNGNRPKRKSSKR